MKLSSLILSATVALNLGLGVLLLTASGDRASQPPAAESRQNSGSAPRSATGPAETNKAERNAVPRSSQLWTKLKSSDDLHLLVARLREAGFPPKVVRAIVGELVHEQFQQRRYEIEGANLEKPYWQKTGLSFADPKIGPELRKSYVEETETLKNILGESLGQMLADDDESKAMLRFQFGNIPDEKLNQLYVYYMEFQQKQAQLNAPNAGGPPLPSDRAKLAELEKSMRDGLSQFLTPAEVQDFTMHVGTAAQQLRYALGPFRPTEDEYRTIFPVYQAYLDQFPNGLQSYATVGSAPNTNPAQQSAQDAMFNQLKASLGDQRAADLQQVMDPQYSTLDRLVARLDLPLTAAKQVMDIQQQTLEQAATIRNDPSLNGPARRAQLTQLAQGASSQVSAALGGDRGLDAYKQYGGQWLVNLVPRPKPKQ